MRYAYALGFAALALASDVHELGKETFEPFIKEHDLVLAECMSHQSSESDSDSTC